MLQLDMGNSRVKWRLRESAQTSASGVKEYGNWSWLGDVARGCPGSVQVSCVASSDAKAGLLQACIDYRLPAPQFASATKSWGRVVSGYRVPERLGVDRWLALLAAEARFPGRPCVVVDSGTALTVDIMAADGRHLGGYIAPGLETMAASLAARSRTLDVGGPIFRDVLDDPGCDTGAAIGSALVVMGRGLIGRALLLAKGADDQVPVCVLAGGDADVWQNWFDGAYLLPDLVLEGLERWFDVLANEGQGG